MRLSAVLGLCAVVFCLAPASADACTSTGYGSLTATLINPPYVTGEVDATGCDIGVYYNGGAGTVQNANVHGARHYGVFVNGDTSNVSVDVIDSYIHQIGDNPFTGNQRGVAVYYRAYYAAGTATGRISGNTVEQYQKGGIVANGPGTDVQIMDNLVTGLGPVGFIAQNGIQVGYGASASVMKNTVNGNSYTGNSWVSGGILVVGGAGYGSCPDGSPCAYTTGTKIVQNTVDGNDVGIYLSNYAADFSAPATATNTKVVNNVISQGSAASSFYQAGISDVGNNDKLIANTIVGYEAGSTFVAKVDADLSFTNRPKVHANR
jgi:hypothetical protein